MSPSRSSSIRPLMKSSSYNPCSATTPSKPSTTRLVPPGYSLTTTITSGGRPSHRNSPTISTSKCHNHRERYPATEALFQLVFRALALLLQTAVLVLIWTLTQDVVINGFFHTKVQYALLSYTMALDVLEMFALANPRVPFLKDAGRKRFPRLPSLYLALAETVALVAIMCTAIVLLNERGTNETRPADCPVLTCVTRAEKLSVYAYLLEMLTGLVHAGFWWGACWHLGKRHITI